MQAHRWSTSAKCPSRGYPALIAALVVEGSSSRRSSRSTGREDAPRDHRGHRGPRYDRPRRLTPRRPGMVEAGYTASRGSRCLTSRGHQAPADKVRRLVDARLGRES